MNGHVFFTWLDVTLLLTLTLFLAAIKMHLSRSFYTNFIFVRRFDMADLQFPASPVDFAFYINGVFAFESRRSKKILRVLKGYLLLNFLYYPAACLFVFALCQKAAEKLLGGAQVFFIVLAWLSLVACLFTFVTNTLLLVNIRQQVVGKSKHPTLLYQAALLVRYTLLLVPLVSVLSLFLYFWLSGSYQLQNRWWALGMAFLVFVFGAIQFFLRKVSDPKVERLKKEAV